MLSPRWYQTAANDAVWQYLAERNGNPVVVLPTGAGKSLLIAMLIRQALEFGGRVVVLAHRKELLQQNADEIRGLIDGVDAGVYSAGLKSREIHNTVVVAGIQSVYRKFADLGRRHLVLVDECFAGDTLISTPCGEKRIDSIRRGDAVYCASGIGFVKAMSSRMAEDVFRLELSNGKIARCTGDHPVFTEKGWKKVREMAVGEVLFSKQAVCKMWEGVHSIQEERLCPDGESIQTAEVLLSVLCKEIEESNEQSPDSAEGQGELKGADAQAYKARRKRAITSLSSACNSSRSWRRLGSRNCGSNRTLQGQLRIPNELQNRHCKPSIEDRVRIGREQPLHIAKTGTGQEKDRILGDVRVVSISSEKRKGITPVFNIHVSGHPSYFANGVLVHNCHLCSDLEETMYRTFLQGIAKANEGLRIVGLSATPFRTGTGPICGPDRIFQRIVFEAQTSQLIAEGFLCPITNKPADAEVNTDKVGLRGGEFIESELQAAFDQDDKVDAACKEILDKCKDRHSILVFASGVHHAEEIAARLPNSAVVTGETLPIERTEILRRFIAQELRFVVNVDVLTTGFNARCVDAIAILRATMSPGLFCQMVGRGLRLHESKTNCYLLDFGGNIARHGSIDDPNFGYSESRSSGKRDAIAAQNGRGKTCPACNLDVAANSRTCPECGFIFPVNHEAKADEDSQLTGEMPPEAWIVVDVHCKKHTKKDDQDAPPTVRVDYVVKKPDTEGNLSTKVISEWVCPEHQGFARSKFCAWWDARSICDFPDTVSDALELIAMGVCRHPASITTKKDGKYTRIVSCEFNSEKPTTLKEVEEARTYTGVDDDCPF